MVKTWKELSKAKKELAKNHMYMNRGKLVDLEASTYRLLGRQKRALDFSNVVYFEVVEVEEISEPVPMKDGEIDMMALLIG